jgi:hypothetical protein
MSLVTAIVLTEASEKMLIQSRVEPGASRIHVETIKLNQKEKKKGKGNKQQTQWL